MFGAFATDYKSLFGARLHVLSRGAIAAIPKVSIFSLTGSQAYVCFGDLNLSFVMHMLRIETCNWMHFISET